MLAEAGATLQLVGPAVVTAGVGLAAFIRAGKSVTTDASNALIDQLQEENARYRAIIDALNARLDER